MKIVFISHSSGLAGSERSLIDLIGGLSKIGVSCRVILPSNGLLEEELQKISIPYDIIFYRWWVLGKDENIEEISNQIEKQSINITDKIREINPDIIYTNTSVINIGAIVAKILGIPHIWHIREFGEKDHGLNFILSEKERYNYISENSSLVIFNSYAVERNFLNFSKPKVYEVVYNNITIKDNDIDKKIQYYNSNFKKILILGFISQSKGQMDAVMAVNKLIKSGMEVELIVAGSVLDDEYFKKIKDYIEEEKIEQYVQILPFVLNPHSLIKETDIILYCSTNEAFGRSILEGFKTRKVVIGTNSGGIPELITDNVNGLLYNSGDYEELAEKIKFICENNKKTKFFIENAYRFTEEHFNEQNYTIKIFDLLKKIQFKNQDAKKLILNNMSIFFSVIMPTYNRKHCIKDAIDSLFTQTYQNFELIIIDDGSKDETEKYIKEIYEKEVEQEKIRYIKLAENIGASDARNEGLKIAKNEWVGYLDSDNKMHLNFLETYAKNILENKEYKIFYAKIKHRNSGIILGHEFIKEELEAGNFIDMGVFVHHVDLFKELGGFNPEIKRLNDWYLILKYTAIYKPFFIDKVLLDYYDGKDFSRTTLDETHDDNYKRAFLGYLESLPDDIFIKNNYEKYERFKIIKEKELILKNQEEKINKNELELKNKDEIINQREKQIKEIELRIKEKDGIISKNELELKNKDEIISQKDIQLNAILNSTIWKITKPMRKISDKIKMTNKLFKFLKKLIYVLKNINNDSVNFIKIKNIPRLVFVTIKKHGIKGFIYKTNNYLNNSIINDNTIVNSKYIPNVNQLLSNRFKNSQIIDFINIKRDEFRLNIVTDSIKKNSLFGGVATSLILATLFSNKYNIPLRIITRETEVNPDDYEKFLDFMKISKPNVVEFFSDYSRNTLGNNFKLELSDKDIFLSTSWWSTEAVKSLNLRSKIFYILQEVEKFFYPNGDEQYLCDNILHDKNINFIINSKLLYDYYLENNYINIIKQGVYFEPAFPEYIYSPNEITFKEKNKYKLFFYSRPNNPRNLFYTGIKIIDEAIRVGILNLDEWDIYFAGADIPELVFSNGSKPIILGHMDWQEYSKFLKEVDLGFCLMYTPHPSYPPLDIASSGGVVLTNSYLNKQSLEYSKNIICVNLEKESMLEGFERAVSLVKDISRRKENYKNNNIKRRWTDSFDDVLDFINKNK